MWGLGGIVWLGWPSFTSQNLSPRQAHREPWPPRRRAPGNARAALAHPSLGSGCCAGRRGSSRITYTDDYVLQPRVSETEYVEAEMFGNLHACMYPYINVACGSFPESLPKLLAPHHSTIAPLRFRPSCTLPERTRERRTSFEDVYSACSDLPHQTLQGFPPRALGFALHTTRYKSRVSYFPSLSYRKAMDRRTCGHRACPQASE